MLSQKTNCVLLWNCQFSQSKLQIKISQIHNFIFQLCSGLVKYNLRSAYYNKCSNTWNVPSRHSLPIGIFRDCSRWRWIFGFFGRRYNYETFECWLQLLDYWIQKSNIVVTDCLGYIRYEEPSRHRLQESRLGWFTAYLANVFLTKLQGPILPRQSRDRTNPNHTFWS